MVRLWLSNNTWNNIQATELGADYILIITDAWLGYPGNDLNKFLWMARIAEAQVSNI